MTNEKESPDQAPAAKHALTQADLAQHIPIIRNYLRKLIRPNELDDAARGGATQRRLTILLVSYVNARVN